MAANRLERRRVTAAEYEQLAESPAYVALVERIQRLLSDARQHLETDLEPLATAKQRGVLKGLRASLDALEALRQEAEQFEKSSAK